MLGGIEGKDEGHSLLQASLCSCMGPSIGGGWISPPPWAAGGYLLQHRPLWVASGYLLHHRLLWAAGGQPGL